MNSFKYLFEGIPKKYNIACILTTILWSTFNVGYVRLLSLLTNWVINGDYNKLPLMIGGFAGYILLWEITEFYADIITYYTGTSIENYTNHWFLNNTYKLKPTIIKKYNTGYLNGLCSKMISNKEKTFNQVVLFAPLGIIYVLYGAFQLSTYNIIYGVALIILVILGIIFRVALKKKSNYYEKILTDAESSRSKRSIDSISNIGTIQKMKSFDFMKKMLTIETDNCFSKTKDCAVFNEIGFTGYKLIIYLFLPVICLIYYLYPDSVIDKSDFFSFIAVISVQLVHTAKNIASTLTEYIKYQAVYEKINEIYCDNNYREDTFNEFFKTAEITNAHHKYYNSDKQITTEVVIPEFILRRGDRVALYGESGQGKTTLLNILSGEIESNSVRLNGLKSDKRLECVFISQDTEMLDMSLRDNLTLGDDSIMDDEIIKLIKACGLEEWFNRQSQGLDTPLGERGVFVSTGQRQRLNLIRGLLKKNGEVYLLDEPTSNIDDYTEKEMVKVIYEYLKDKTVVIVTHRQAIMSICTKAYKFTNGILGNEEIL